MMRLFRRSLDPAQGRVRPASADDLTAVSRLFRDGQRRFQSFAGPELEPMLAEAPGMLLSHGSEVWGVALCSWPTGSTAWLRGVALAEGLEVRPALALLLPQLHNTLLARNVAHCFYGGDDTADLWLHPALLDQGYVADTDVIVFEKRTLAVPAEGNQVALVRPARPSDTAAITELDRRCFDAQWTKDSRILEPAITQGPLFVVAELEGRTVGYAFATSHFGGRLIHLVRIAVDPHMQGQGLGVRLMAEVVAFARLYGADSITLNTQSYNTHAQRLYRWFGFTLTGERQAILRHDQ